MTSPQPPVGVPLPQTGLSGSLPGAIADLNSLARDITFARQCAVGYPASMPPAPNEEEAQGVGRQALWFAGAISYRRAFTSGRGHLVAHGSRVRINDFVEAGGAQPGAGGPLPKLGGRIGVGVMHTAGPIQACSVEHRRAAGHLGAGRAISVMATARSASARSSSTRANGSRCSSASDTNADAVLAGPCLRTSRRTPAGRGRAVGHDA
jgi:hypothetical protein